MQRIVLLLLAVLLFHGCSESSLAPQSKSLQWQSLAPLGDEHVYSAAVLDGVIYAIDASGTLQSLDAESGKWQTRSTAPLPRDEAMLVAARGELFLIGGETDTEPVLDRFESYDPRSDRWTLRAPLPVAVCMMGALADDQTIYVIGGDGGGGSGPARFVQRYDLSSESWSLGADLPTPRCGLALVRNRDTILATGGILYDEVQEKWALVDVVEQYDPRRDEWTELPPLPAPRFRHAAISFDGRAYLIGGLEIGAWQSDPSRASVLEFRSFDASWSPRTPIEFPRYAHAAVTLGEGLYVFGGRSDLRTVEPSVERGTLR